MQLDLVDLQVRDLSRYGLQLTSQRGELLVSLIRNRGIPCCKGMVFSAAQGARLSILKLAAGLFEILNSPEQCQMGLKQLLLPLQRRLSLGPARKLPCYRNFFRFECVLAAARAGDAATLAMLDEQACYMGIALANLVNILNPDLIVLGGICAQGEELLLPAIELTMRQRAFAGLGERVRLQTTL